MLRNLFLRFILIIIATCLLIFIEYKFEVVDYLRFPNAVKTFEVNSASDSIVYSPDGKMFAVAGGKRIRSKISANGYTQGYSQVEVRRTIDGSIVKSWDFFSAQSLAFNSDNSTIAAGSRGSKVSVWRISDGELLHSLNGVSKYFTTTLLVFTPNGRYLAVSYSRSVPSDFFVGAPRWSDARYYGRIRIWRIEDGKQLQTFRGHKYRTYEITFSPDSQYLTSTGADGKVRLWKMPPCNYGWLWLLSAVGLAVLIYWRRTNLIGLINR